MQKLTGLANINASPIFIIEYFQLMGFLQQQFPDTSKPFCF